MAGRQEDFFSGEDLDAIFAVIDQDLLSKDDQSQPQCKDDPTTSVFSCQACDKRCVTQRGLTRHINSKHSASTNIVCKPPEEKLTLAKLESLLQESVKKLSEDECYSEEILKELKNYSIADNVHTTYHIIKPVISSFNGDAERFYPDFYKCVSENCDVIFPGLSKNCPLLLGFEVCNHVLAHLSGVQIKDDILSFNDEKFSEKEKAIVGYLSGYVFGTMYRRIRFNAKSSDEYPQQCLSILLAGHSDDVSLPEHKLVDSRNRSGLWKVKLEVINIFITAESTFKSMVSRSVNKIDSKAIVSSLLINTNILTNFSKITGQTDLAVKREVAMNLLEDLLLLYIRTRTFSHIKDKQQIYKIQSSKLKSKSLRTGLKNKSEDLH